MENNRERHPGKRGCVLGPGSPCLGPVNFSDDPVLYMWKYVSITVKRSKDVIYIYILIYTTSAVCNNQTNPLDKNLHSMHLMFFTLSHYLCTNARSKQPVFALYLQNVTVAVQFHLHCIWIFFCLKNI